MNTDVIFHLLTLKRTIDGIRPLKMCIYLWLIEKGFTMLGCHLRAKKYVL